MSSRLRRVARAGVLVAAVALPLVAAAVQARRELAPEGIGVDDAFIFLRYGRNLAHGLGWVWNPGGPAVEGATSTLWTLAAAAGFRLTSDPSALLFGASLTLVVLALALWLAALLGPEGGRTAAGGTTSLALLALAVGLDLAARPAFAVWTAASLMDGGLWCAATLVAAATLARAARDSAGTRPLLLASSAQVALALARPEAMLVGPALVAAAALASRRPLRSWLAPIGAATAAQLGLLIWRLTTFGWALPNTYYAKVGGDLADRLRGGLGYLTAAVLDDPSHLLVWSLAAGVLARAVRARRRAWQGQPDGLDPGPALAATVALLAPAIVLAVGGDHFGGQRVLVQLRPFESTLVAAWILGLARRRTSERRARALVASALAAGAGLSYALATPRWGDLARTTRLEVEFTVARVWLGFGHELDRLFADAPRPPTAGVITAGALPFVYRGPSLDLMGLNDPAMAHASRRRVGVYGHAAFSPAVFFERPPDLVLVVPPRCATDPLDGSFSRFLFRNVLAGLHRDEVFRSRFRHVRLFDPTRNGIELCTFARVAWLDSGASGARWEELAEPLPTPLHAPAPAAPVPTR